MDLKGMALHIGQQNHQKPSDGYSGNKQFPVRIAYVWASVALAIILYSVVWITFGRVLFEVITAIEVSYTFTGQSAWTVELIKLVIAWHPVLALFGWIAWGYVMSTRRDERAYSEPYAY